MLWCLQVTVTPLLSRIKVFNKGTPKPRGISVPLTGQQAPPSIPRLRLECKYPQNKLKNRRISLTINKHIPQRILLVTVLLWKPSSTLSMFTSFHQAMAARATPVALIIIHPCHIPIIHPPILHNLLPVSLATISGQGLVSTM